MWCDVVWCGEFWRASVSLCLCRLSEGPWVWRMDAWHGMGLLGEGGSREEGEARLPIPEDPSATIQIYSIPLPSTHLFSTAHENFYHLELLLIILHSLHLIFTSSQLTSSYQYLRTSFDSMTVNSSASSHIVNSHGSERRQKNPVSCLGVYKGLARKSCVTAPCKIAHQGRLSILLYSLQSAILLPGGTSIVRSGYQTASNSPKASRS